MCRKLILSVNISSDGYMAGPQGELDWHFDHWNSEMADYAWHQLNTADTLLMGRVAYEAMSAHWSQAVNTVGANPRDSAYAQRMNSLPKIVLSRTLQHPSWNNTRVVGDHWQKEILQLKQEPGRDILLWGGVRIVSDVIAAGLIDEYRLFIAPVLLGKGQPLYTALSPHTYLSLNLLSTQSFSNGVVLHCYQNARASLHEKKNELQHDGRNI